MRSIFFFSAILLLSFIACNNENKEAPSASAHHEWTLLPFVKSDSVNPIMAADATLSFMDPIWKKEIKWATKDVFNPAAIVRNDTVFLFFRAEDTIGKYNGTSRVGIAYSTDGLHFTKHPHPVLFPDNDEFKKWEWEGGCEDPRVVQDETGMYYMMYSSYDGKIARLMVATSPDLFTWTKHGSAFKSAYNGKYVNNWSKSGSVVSTYKNGTPVATKIGDKYWMYWGDVNVWAATSDDLINWSPVLYENGEKYNEELRHNATEIPEIKTVFGPRKGKFDSDLVEPGPPAMLTDKGIRLLYNGRNVPQIGDANLPEGTYSSGQVLMDKNNPTQVLNRMDTFFLKPEKDYEITGQVGQVVFIEGLVGYKGRWFLYYGTADSKIAAAVKNEME